MRSTMMILTLVFAFAGCARNADSMRSAIKDSVQVELLDHGPNPEPSLWVRYSLLVPTMDTHGDPLSSEVSIHFYVNGRSAEDYSTSGRSSGEKGHHTQRILRGELKPISGTTRLPLHAVGTPGESAEVRCEVVYYVKNETTGDLLFSGINSTTKTVQRPETQQPDGAVTQESARSAAP